MDKNARKLRNQDINPCLQVSLQSTWSTEFENTHLFFLSPDLTLSHPPCQETDASQKCLDAYNYDKRMCSAYFQAYKDCRKYWVSYRVFLFRCLFTVFLKNDEIE